MTDTQHTPGPWVVRGSHIHETSPSFSGIATVQTFDNPDWAANARLIASAPDLLEALEGLLGSDLVKWFPPWPPEGNTEKGPPWSEELKQRAAPLLAARAAIAKATGE